MGQAGVTKALEVIQSELDNTMALTGVQKISDISRNQLLVPKDFEGDWI
jgi:L-lactate dehydrogenase (cytochrome)